MGTLNQAFWGGLLGLLLFCVAIVGLAVWIGRDHDTQQHDWDPWEDQRGDQP